MSQPKRLRTIAEASSPVMEAAAGAVLDAETVDPLYDLTSRLEEALNSAWPAAQYLFEARQTLSDSDTRA